MMTHASLRTKLTAGFGILILALVANSLVGYVSIAKLAETTELTSQTVERRRLVNAMQFGMEMQRAGLRAYLIGNPNLDEMEEGQRTFQSSLDQYSSLVKTDQGRSLLSNLLQPCTQYGQLVDRVIQLRRNGKTAESIALTLSPEANQIRAAVNADFSELLKYEQTNRNSAQTEGRAAETETRLLLGIFGVVGLAFGLAVATLVPRSLSNRITGMINVINEIAANNLTVADLHVTVGDELGHAGTGLNTMKNSLRTLIQSIARAAEHVASASEELSSSATQQAQTADSQKGQSAQVAVAMQEMSSTVEEVSQNSNRASEASRQAAETARQGGVIVEDALTKMRSIADSVSATAQRVEELGKSSDQIGRIIGVIDDIADQTNLLALNAAIEAARAGEQGRGFAVVADEVRKLAERTTSATKEVAQMVQGIQSETRNAVAAMNAGTHQVQEGVQTTAQAGNSLRDIIRMSEQVGEMIAHIATAATEQSSATEQVNQNVEQITRLVNESAVGAQESAKACLDLSGLALDLQKMVSEFRLNEAGPASASGQFQSGNSKFGERGAASHAQAFSASAH